MMNSLNLRQKLAFLFRLNSHRTLRFHAAKKSPAAFRSDLRLVPHKSTPFSRIIQPWQEADFHALDPAWKNLAGLPVQPLPPYQRAYIERPRGHSKTSDMAIQLAWILLFARNQVTGIATAADRDQASLIRNALEFVARLNPALCSRLQIHKHEVRNPRTGSKLEIISSDARSSWGHLPDFVICDELCHWDKPDLWQSLLSSAAKKPDCVLVVLTNAGVGRGWQWNVREAARTSSDWYFSSLAGSQAPWITARWLDEQQKLLPRPVFDRLWRNLWQHSDGDFLTLSEAEACRDSSLRPQTHGQPHLHYFAAIDFAEKHDYTVAILLHRDGHRLVVDRMDVAVPTPDSPVKVQWVDDWVRRISANFHSVTFIFDEYQLVGTIQHYEAAQHVIRFPFAAGVGNHALALNLRKLIIHRQLAWYPGCGQLEHSSQRDDLETELASLLLKQSPTGRCRIDHLPDNQHHDDRAFALGAAALYAVQSNPTPDWLDITPPTPTGNFHW